jgi:hypothetical protein
VASSSGVGWQRVFRGMAGAILAAALVAGCEGGPEDDPANELSNELVTEDGLAQAFSVFKDLFTTQFHEDQHHHVSFGFHPGLSTVRLLGPFNAPVNGQVVIHFVTDLEGTAGTVEASLVGPANSGFDLYFVKNTVGSAKPESGDVIHKVGTFKPVSGSPNQYSLKAKIGSAPFPQFGVNFDLDLVVVTPARCWSATLM